MNSDQMQVHNILFQRYYNTDSKPMISDKFTSSHWKDFSDKIKVESTVINGKEDYDLTGYGFGENREGNLFNKILTIATEVLTLASLRAPGLSEEIKRSKVILRKMGLPFSNDAFRQVCTLNFLKNKLKEIGKPGKILIIGDGNGILSGLLHDAFPESNIYLIDLGPVLFFQSFYLNKLYPDVSKRLLGTSVESEAVYNFCSADDLSFLNGIEFDLAINIASMQEMDMKIVNGYFDLLRKAKTKAFYCCNRLEKRMPGGEISRFMEYPWLASDKILVDEPCPWHQWLLGYASTPNVKFMGMPLPFVHEYDGQHWHRLSLLSK